jgi:hypothetical protein
MKQERPPMRGGPHPALRERGRAIPPGVPPVPAKNPIPMPPHVRVRSSPLEVYFGLDIKVSRCAEFESAALAGRGVCNI